ncbi:MAG: SRPBCC family protein [Fibrobacteria bacterium]
MLKTIRTVHQINAPAPKLWSNISKASGVDAWLPVIKSCRLTGIGLGASRICISEQGELTEKILEIDPHKRVFRYAVEKQPFFPITDIVGTMTVAGDEKKAQLSWDLSFHLNDESMFPMIKQAIEGMYQAGAQGLETISK